jgi:hypothetical protein
MTVVTCTFAKVAKGFDVVAKSKHPFGHPEIFA